MTVDRTVRAIAISALLLSALRSDASTVCVWESYSFTRCEMGADGKYYCEMDREERLLYCYSGAGVNDYPGGPGDSGYAPGQDRDYDLDGYMDYWSDVLTTVDPCADNFDWGDRLGSDHGGPNSDTNVPPGESGRPWHNGVDIQGDVGDPVYSIGRGVVEFAGTSGNCGNRVTIRHDDGSAATYCHLDTIAVQIGDRTSGGTYLGGIGDTGSPAAGAYHLHLTFQWADGSYDEYFNYTNFQPPTSALNPSGC